MWGYLSHDIGGFHDGSGAPGDADPKNLTGSELLLRWIQFGAVAPILRTHCDHCERRIWLFPYFDAMRDAMRLRNALGATWLRWGWTDALGPSRHTEHSHPLHSRFHQCRTFTRRRASSMIRASRL